METLEPRIAPAAVLNVTDIDGDVVSIITSKGTLAQLTAAVKMSGQNLTGTIQEIDFSTVPLVNGTNPFAGTDLSVLVRRVAPNGDGRVHVGYIDASALDDDSVDGAGLPLGRLVVQGDLGQIDAGAGGFNLALRSLLVQSLGNFGTLTQASGGTLTSNLLGTVGVFKVQTGVMSSTVVFTAPTALIDFGTGMTNSTITGVADITTLKVGGGVFGNSSIVANSVRLLSLGGSLFGTVDIENTLNSFAVRGDVDGGAISAKTIGVGVITGSLLGKDSVANSGQVSAQGNLGALTIGRDLLGANALRAGSVIAGGNVGTIAIGGSIIAPTAPPNTADLTLRPQQSAAIFVTGNAKAIRVGGDLRGPNFQMSGVTSAPAIATAYLEVGGDIGSLVFGGSIIGGNLDSSSGSSSNVTILAKHIGAMRVGGDIRGQQQFPSIFTVGGDGVAALGSLVVGGSVAQANIVAGSGFYQGTARTADAVIGTVVIRGDVTNTKLMTLDSGPGIADNASVDSRIAVLQIGGVISGNTQIRAEEIVAAKVGTRLLPFTRGAHNDVAGFSFPPGAGSIAEYV